MSSNHHHHQHHQGDGMEAVPFSTTFDASANHEQQPPVMASVGAAEAGGGGGEIWLDGREEELDENLLVDVSDSSIFYTDFPPLPDFPCMSSSSSTSSSAPTSAKPLHAKSSCSTSSSSSSSAVSWTAFNNPQPQHFEGTDQRKRRHYDHSSGGDAASAALISTASMEIDLPPPDQDCISEDVDCINVMENFGYMDLLDNNDIWDPCSIFQFENPQEDEQQAAAQQQQQKDEDGGNEHDQLYFLQGNSELAVIFLEWLKQNREYISAEDMRNIKLKRSTIECASKRLGSTKEGKKQLLKLILEWVEQYQLQRKRVKETVSSDSPNYHHFHQHHHQESSPSFQPANNPNPNPNSDLNCNAFPHPQDPNNPCFPPPGNWMPAPPPYAPESPFPAMGGFVCDPYGNGPGQNMYPPPSEYQPQMDCYQQQPQFAMAPQYSQFPDNSSGGAPVYGSPYPYPLYDGNGERLMRLGSSATKEARKKRMARQRRLSIHQYRHHHNHQNQNQLQQVQGDELNAIGNSEDQNCNSNNWVYWPTPNVPCSSAVPNNLVAPAPGDCDIRSNMQQQNQRQPLSDRREGYKTEKNLKFLLQKVLKQSDVGNLGRIVLPKKEAESHLPELETRDGISIAMEDIGTSNVWNMRYRFWPNNKSRMYLLENTGDFVRVNGLQEGDFIVIYSDTKCGKYLIRGVKVRQPGTKAEGKKPARRNMRNSNLNQAAAAAATAAAGGGGSFSQLDATPFKQTVK